MLLTTILKITVEGEKKIGGPGFWIMITIAMMDDSFDIISTLFFFLINAIPVAGQAIGAASATIFTFLGMLVTGTLVLYLHFNKVSLFSRKMASKMLMLLLEQVPLLGMLPLTTVFFYLTVQSENFLRKHKTMQLLNRKFEH